MTCLFNRLSSYSHKLSNMLLLSSSGMHSLPWLPSNSRRYRLSPSSRDLSLSLRKCKGLYEKYFEGKSLSPSAARMGQKVNPQLFHGRWARYPYPPNHTSFWNDLGSLAPRSLQKMQQVLQLIQQTTRYLGCNRLICFLPFEISTYAREDIVGGICGLSKSCRQSVSNRNQLEINDCG